MSDHAIVSVLQVKRLQKLNKRDCFCLHSWFHFSWSFLRKNWLTQLMGQTKLCHHPPPSTSTHHQPQYVHHHPPIPTTIHHHPPPAKIYPLLPTISQKMNRHPVKIYSYITSFRHCFNRVFFFAIFLSVMEILCDKVLISSFFKFQISAIFSTFYDI